MDEIVADTTVDAGQGVSAPVAASVAAGGGEAQVLLESPVGSLEDAARISIPAQAVAGR